MNVRESCLQSLLPTQCLQLHILVVSAAAGKELVVRAGLADCAVFNEISTSAVSFFRNRDVISERCLHAVRVLNGGQTMCDGDGRPAFCRTIKRFLHYPLRVRVEGGCRLKSQVSQAQSCRSGKTYLIQQKDLRVSEQCPSDGDTFCGDQLICWNIPLHRGHSRF